MGFTLSVVIPNYNNGKFLSQCVGSIACQSYKELIEIIIVDDCSTDNSKEIILELSAKYDIVKPLFLEKNGKVSAARNAGLAIAKGEYITFIDADDYYYNPDKLKNEMELIQKHKEIGKDIVAYSSIVRVSNDGVNVYLPQNPKRAYYQGMIYEKLLVDLKSTMVMRDYCVKTQILRDIGGYNVENSLFEDYELILKIAKNIGFYYTDATGTAYRNSVSGLSKKPQKILVKKKNEIINKQIKNEPLKKRIKIKFERSVISFLKKIYRVFKR